MTIPRWAPRPDATIRATGVAKPRAQGQAITSTAIPVAIALVSCESYKYQAKPVANATSVTTGTKMALILFTRV